jgi:hypothetical protein
VDQKTKDPIARDRAALKEHSLCFYYLKYGLNFFPVPTLYRTRILRKARYVFLMWKQEMHRNYRQENICNLINCVKVNRVLIHHITETLRRTSERKMATKF